MDGKVGRGSARQPVWLLLLLIDSNGMRCDAWDACAALDRLKALLLPHHRYGYGGIVPNEPRNRPTDTDTPTSKQHLGPATKDHTLDLIDQ